MREHLLFISLLPLLLCLALVAGGCRDTVEPETGSETHWLSCQTTEDCLEGQICVEQRCDYPAGYVAPEPDPAPVESAMLVRAQGCEEVRARLEDSLVETMTQGVYGASDWMFDVGSLPPEEPLVPSRLGPGVETLDWMKLGSTHAYVLVDGEVVVLTTAALAEATRVPVEVLDGEIAQGMVLLGDRLVVVVARPEAMIDVRWSLTPQQASTRLLVYDLTDPGAPALSRELRLDAAYEQAGVIDGELLLITRSFFDLLFESWEIDDPRLPDLREVWSAETTAEEMSAIRARARGIYRETIEAWLDERSVDDLVPRVTVVGSQGEEATSPLFACEDLYTPQGVAPNRLTLLSRVDLDAATGDPLATSALMVDGGVNTPSETPVRWSRHGLDLYVAGGWNPRWWGTPGITHLHRFAPQAEGPPRHVASGAFEGDRPPRFVSWGASAELARVVGNEAAVVMRRQGEGFEVAGAARLDFVDDEDSGIADTYVAGEMAYVVTHRFEPRFDALTVIDLRDPSAPRVAGQVSFDGFGGEIYPVGPGRVLMIGRGTITNEVQAQLFDVSDPDHPALVDREVFDHDTRAGSEAKGDRRAFTFDADSGVAAFPVHMQVDTHQGEAYAGMHVLRVSESGLEPLARISHRALLPYSACETSHECEVATQPRRSTVRDGRIYTWSRAGLTVHDLTQLSEAQGAVALRR